jgi:vancomycin resistance protein VanJ
MKKLSLTDKFIYFLNTLFAVVLLFSYSLTYVKPASFGLLSVLSLAVPVLILINIAFLIYWLLKTKKQWLISFFVLVFGYNHVLSLYKFSSSKTEINQSSVSIMTYNVRLFNLYDWIDRPDVEKDIIKLINNQDPDILCLQEYHPHKNIDLSAYPYKYEELSGTKLKYGQAIFSKFPFANKGSVKFPNTANNAIFADVVINSDTIRMYNIHLQSSKIDADVAHLDSKKSEQMLRSLKKTFKIQQHQTEKFLAHKSKSPYKVIVAGDFNNTAYSYVYKEISRNLTDAFIEAGKGFGRTFRFKYFPLRIDFILADPTFKVNSYQTLDQKYSDHYPVISTIQLHE